MTLNFWLRNSLRSACLRRASLTRGEKKPLMSEFSSRDSIGGMSSSPGGSVSGSPSACSPSFGPGSGATAGGLDSLALSSLSAFNRDQRLRKGSFWPPSATGSGAGASRSFSDMGLVLFLAGPVFPLALALAFFRLEVSHHEFLDPADHFRRDRDCKYLVVGLFGAGGLIVVGRDAHRQQVVSRLLAADDEQRRSRTGQVVPVGLRRVAIQFQPEAVPHVTLLAVGLSHGETARLAGGESLARQHGLAFPRDHLPAGAADFLAGENDRDRNTDEWCWTHDIPASDQHRKLRFQDALA